MKKMIIALMLVLLMVFAVACGTDKKNDKNNAQVTPSADVTPEDEIVPDMDNDTVIPETEGDGDMIPDNGDNAENNGSGTENGNNNTAGNGTADPNATVIPELVPSDDPSASASGENVQK